jgi:hypothetical protein
MPKPSNIVMSQKLPNVLGKTRTALLVHYEPEGKTLKHRHPGSEHLVSENASLTEPASLLAVFVADDGATLRIDDP